MTEENWYTILTKDREKQKNVLEACNYIAKKIPIAIKYAGTSLGGLRNKFLPIKEASEVASIKPLLDNMYGYFSNYFIDHYEFPLKVELEYEYKCSLTNEAYESLENLFQAIKCRQRRV